MNKNKNNKDHPSCISLDEVGSQKSWIMMYVNDMTHSITVHSGYSLSLQPSFLLYVTHEVSPPLFKFVHKDQSGLFATDFVRQKLLQVAQNAICSCVFTSSAFANKLRTSGKFIFVGKRLNLYNKSSFHHLTWYLPRSLKTSQVFQTLASMKQPVRELN